MSIDRQIEREEQDICDRYNSGEIDDKQFSQEMRELQAECRAMAEDAAQEAYENAMNNC